jgi:RND family efflux transporter MFP subunit
MPNKLRFLVIGALAALPASAWAADEPHVSSVLIKLIEQVDVPAREAGVLDKVLVREGDLVEEGARLAQIEDVDALLDMRRAQLELVGARKAAESDVQVRYARKSLEVAESELRRAVDSAKRLAQSVSQSEMEQLKLEVQRGALEVEQAQLELDLAKVTAQAKENDVQIAEHNISQRRINSPLAGFVAEIHRHRGEWVQPGQAILRILRLDRLRAEGLVNAALVNDGLMGRSVQLTVQIGDEPTKFTGKIAFVSPEVDPVNGQVRVWAEVENTGLKLRPGLHGSMTIGEAPAEKPAR